MKHVKRKIIGIVSIGVVIGVVSYLFSLGVNFPDFITALAVALVAGILTIGYWMLKPEINKFTGNKKTKSHAILKFVKFNPSHRKKEDGKLYKRFRGDLKNFSKISINELQYYYSYQNKEPMIEEILNDKRFRQRGIKNNGALLPESVIAINSEEFQYDESESNPLWFTIWLDYEFESEKESYIFVLRINGESVANEDVRIYDPATIEKKRVDLKKKENGI